MQDNKKVIAIIVAAGSGSRMGISLPKQFMKIGSTTVLEEVARKFEKNRNIDGFFVVSSEEYLEYTQELLKDYKKLIAVVIGGKTRQASVKNALDAMKDEECFVLVHDAARPYVRESLIDSVLKAAVEFGAAIPVIEETDTIKAVESLDGIRSFVKTTMDRSRLKRVQTPQGFSFSLLKEAYDNASKLGFEGTDDASLVEAIGEIVTVVHGDESNIKITRINDMPTENRVGNGFDVHKLKEGLPLVIGGEKIPYEKGLIGHSDADVLTHAVMDALLGAAKLGDIGRMFPDTEEAYKGANSISLLENVGRKIKEEGYEVINIDATVICEKPKLAEHIQRMEENIAQALQIETKRVNIKATTTEGLGYEGRGEGISASSVCLLQVKNN